MFEKVAEGESFDDREKKILEFWQKERIFERSVEQRKNGTPFIFYDGPPFATGLPHYGHILAGTIKDVVLRYRSMRGNWAPRRFGWDCHGLPIENEVEKAKGLTGAASIEEFGIAKFNEECRSIVLRYTSEWKTIVERMGRWVDFSQTYRTMDKPFMESVWWIFKQLYEKGLVYEGYKVMPFSAKLGTPLSNFEAGENYKEVDDPSLTVAFQLKDEPHTTIWIWTTTPWTLPSNLALMVGPEIDYVQLQLPNSEKQVILAEARQQVYAKELEAATLVRRFKGQELIGKSYISLLPYFSERAAQGAFKIIAEPTVSIEEGTGVVHAAPAFGEVDFYACQRAGIELVCPVDTNGRFLEPINEYVGLFVKDADKDIIKRLKQQGSIVLHTVLHHRYPFCWRSDTPLIYKVVQTWFVGVEQIKDRLLAANSQIDWIPGHIKEGRFGKWLEGARDWAISRNRYWGTPIPIWRAEDGEIFIIGSVEELEKATGQKIDDLHRHFLDHLEIEHNGKTFKRIAEVFDCWFESGSMPYAQNHYPFEQKAEFEQNFPADFIGEGLDQTRGWFYTLTVLATALFDKPAFKHVIVNGIILAADGTKMSKRLRNYPDPMEVVKKYGADAVRLYMMYSPAVRAEALSFKETGVELTLRQVMIPWWNAFNFFTTYARIYEWEPDAQSLSQQPSALIDRWILSLLNRLIRQVKEGFDSYQLDRAVNPFVDFIDQLTNWYIRRCRRRFWDEKDTQDRRDAFATLYRVLMTLSQVAAPVVPFLSDAIYRQLRLQTDPESVHLCDFPEELPEQRDIHLEDVMGVVQTTVSLGHALRKEHKLKVRQPLPVAHIASSDSAILSYLQEQQYLIADELNVKLIAFSDDDSRFVRISAKPNFRVLGKKVGKKMPAVQAIIDRFTAKEIGHFQEKGSLTIDLDGELFELVGEDLQIERFVHEGMIAANAGAVTIALETNLDDSLLQEGIAREIINKVNTMRRDGNLAVTDRINMTIDSTPRVRECFIAYEDMIKGEVLALSVHFAPCSGVEWDLNGERALMAIEKAS